MAFPRSEARLAGIARGLARCGRRFGLAVVGGNMTRARELSITIAVVGSVREGRVLTREGARVGDAVMVSGTLGDAALGLEKGAAASLVRRQHRPFPRLELGRALAGIATAAIDVSDGLLLDLGHLCHSSRVGASVRLSELPLSPAYLARMAGRADQYGPALAGGEDYELCLTVPVRQVPAAIAAARELRVPLSTVGSIIEGEGVRVARCRGGLHLARRLGHDHFA
jgi:thiamine-monophosphate kinase